MDPSFQGGFCHNDVMMYVGHYDQTAAAAPPPHLSKENI
jgi:hypothetical protein